MIVLTDTELAISGALDGDQLTRLDDVVRHGRPSEGDLGRHGLIVELDEVVELRLRRDDTALDLLLGDGMTSIGIRPPEWATVASLFEEIRRARAPTAPVRSTLVDPAPGVEPSQWTQMATTTLMAATGGLGALLCVFASMEPATVGRSDGVGSLLGTVFATVGFVPALVCFVATLVLAVGRLIAERRELRRRAEVRHEVRVVVPARRPERAVAAAPPPGAIVYAAPADGSDPLADILRDTK